MALVCEHGNEFFGFRKSKVFLDCLNDCLLLKKDLAL